MARTRRAAAPVPRSVRLERWDVLGFIGFALAGIGVLAFIGIFTREGFVVAAVGAAFAEVFGRAAPIAAIVSALLGPPLLLSGTRRQASIGIGHIVAAVVFVLGGLFALSTGSSWGTFALLMPIAIPVAHETGASLPVTLAAVLSGGIFGDHCSPVSDTTILSSMASGCTHADHVNTQLVYALTTGATAFVGFVVAGLTGFHGTIAIVLVLQVLITVGLTWFLGAPAHPR